MTIKCMSSSLVKELRVPSQKTEFTHKKQNKTTNTPRQPSAAPFQVGYTLISTKMMAMTLSINFRGIFQLCCES